MISFKKYLLEDDSGESNNHEHKTEEERKLLIPIHHNGNSNNQNPPIVFANVSNIFIKEQKLGYLWFICITYFIFAVFEVVGGFYSNSIAIMSDAAHSFSDCFCFLICIVSIYVTKKGTTSAMSFGFHRGEIIGMLVSVTIIWGLSFWLFYSATMKILYPSEVNGLIMLLVALIGLFFNLIMGTFLMHNGVGHSVLFQDSSNNVCQHHVHPVNELSCTSIRGTFKHVIGDSIQSCTIIAAGVLIYFYPNYTIADPICTFCFTGIVLFTAYETLKRCIGILMEGAPLEFDVDKLGNELLEIKGVVEVHDLHVWSLSVGKVSMSCHLISTSPQISLKKARDMMKKKYNITHSTIQVELDTEKFEHSCKHDLHK